MADPNLGWAAGAGLIGSGWLAYLLAFRKWDVLMSRFWEGADGRASFSKFQFWVWTLAVVVGLLSLWIARILATEGIVSPFEEEIPENLMGVLGLSTGTAVGAKVLTTNYVNGQLTRKMAKKGPTGGAGKPAPRETTPVQELLSDDDGIPDLSKLQMFLFTAVAVIIFLMSVGDRIQSGDADVMVLPDVDQSLLILMGISATAYVGKKVVTRDRPTITAVTPSDVPAGETTPVMLTGRSLGDKDIGVLRVGPRLYKEATEKEDMDWSSSVISFKFDAAGIAPGNHLVEVVVGDTKSEPAVLRVV